MKQNGEGKQIRVALLHIADEEQTLFEALYLQIPTSNAYFVCFADVWFSLYY